MRKGNTSWSSVYLEDDSDYRSEDDSAPLASDEGPTAGATKRKREVGLNQTSNDPVSRVETILMQGYVFGIEREQKAEGLI
jgi:hypothetical protein